jgi:hypothetical protein
VRLPDIGRSKHTAPSIPCYQHGIRRWDSRVGNFFIQAMLDALADTGGKEWDLPPQYIRYLGNDTVGITHFIGTTVWGGALEELSRRKPLHTIITP